jgi:hypothetical protein
MELSQIHIYRMTHIKNIPHILEYGITHKKSPNANPNYISIGDISLIDKRTRKEVHISNGNKIYKTIILGDFIPFYFWVRMPMLYVIKYGGNHVEKATPPQDIVYVVCKLSDIVLSGIDFYFSDGHAVNSFSTFYDSSKVEELPVIIDENAIKNMFWTDPDIKRKKEAEFLVANDIPPNFLFGFICYNEITKQRLIDMNIDTKKIKVDKQAYY